MRTLADLHLLRPPGACCDLAHSDPFLFLDGEEVAAVRGAVARQAGHARASAVGAAVLPDLAIREPWLQGLFLHPRLHARVVPHVPVPVRVHPMLTNLAHVNLQTPGADVFDWHVDSSPLSVVTMLSEVPDGEGATELRDGRGTVHPLRYPGPGWAVVVQGSVVPHRARPTAWGERITLVTSLVPADPFVADTKNLRLALHYTDPERVALDYLSWRMTRLAEQAALLRADEELERVRARLGFVQAELADTLRWLDAARAVRDGGDPPA